MEHGASRAKAESAAPDASVSSAWHLRLLHGPQQPWAAVFRQLSASPERPGAAQTRGTAKGE